MSRTTTLLLACLAILLAQAGITLYLPTLPDITLVMRGSPRFPGMTLTIFLLGMALPMLWWGHWCARYGTLRVLILTLLLHGASALAITAVSQAWDFLGLRFIQGVAAGGMSVGARSLVRQRFEGDELAKALSLLSLCFVASLGVVQFFGAQLALIAGWSAGFLLTGLMSLLLALALLPMRHGRMPGPSHVSFWPIYIGLLKSPAFLRPALAGGFGYAIIVVFNATAPMLFQQQFGWNSVAFGWLGWPVSLAYMTGALLAMFSTLRLERLFRHGLWGLLIGSGLMILASTLARQDPLPLWLSYCVVLVGQGIVYPLCLTLASRHCEHGPQAMALTALLHQLMAVIAGGLTGGVQVDSSLGLALACAVLAGLSWVGVHSSSRQRDD